MYHHTSTVRSVHLNPCRHSGQHIHQQASMLGIVACHEIAVHDEALAQVACDDEARMEEQDNVQGEEEACRGHSSN